MMLRYVVKKTMVSLWAVIGATFFLFYMHTLMTDFSRGLIIRPVVYLAETSITMEF